MAKDKNAPKRAMNAYFLFANENRNKIQSQNPDLKITEISKILSENYKKLSDKERKVYEDKNAKDKERYEREMAVYQEKLKSMPPVTNSQMREKSVKKEVKGASSAKSSGNSKGRSDNTSSKGKTVEKSKDKKSSVGKSENEKKKVPAPKKRKE